MKLTLLLKGSPAQVEKALEGVDDATEKLAGFPTDSEWKRAVLDPIYTAIGKGESTVDDLPTWVTTSGNALWMHEQPEGLFVAYQGRRHALQPEHSNGCAVIMGRIEEVFGSRDNPDIWVVESIQSKSDAPWYATGVAPREPIAT